MQGPNIPDVTKPMRVVVYSSDAGTRRQVTGILGVRPNAALGDVEFIEIATHPALIERVRAGDVDLAILDAEATPAGGLGSAKQLNDEMLRCPPLVVLTNGIRDEWLVRWSGADAVVSRPIDPVTLSVTFAEALRIRAAASR